MGCTRERKLCIRRALILVVHSEPGQGTEGVAKGTDLQVMLHCAVNTLKSVTASDISVLPQAGDTICHEGSSSDYFYMVGHGQFDARVQEGTAASSVVATFACQPGATAASFGELSLLYPQPWQYSVVARTSGMLWALHRSPYRQLLQQFDAVAVLSGDLSGTAVGVGVGANGTASTSPKPCARTLEPAAAESELESLLQVLRNVEVLRVLAPSQLYRLVAVMEQQRYSDGQYIIHEGDEGDDFFLMQVGRSHLVESSAAVREPAHPMHLHLLQGGQSAQQKQNHIQLL